MGSLYVKNGTPVGTASLCSTCGHAHRIEGYRESEAIVLCTYASYDRALMIPFRVKTCSNHQDRTRPTWDQMEELALPIEKRNSAKEVGFLIGLKKELNSTK